MFDYHIHSTNSFDGQGKMIDCARAAREKGFSEICFTEHLEIGYPYEIPGSDLFGFKYAPYAEEIREVRAAVPEIGIKMGIELGLIHAQLPAFSRAVTQGGYDFVIASQHVVEGKDPYFGDYFEGKSAREGQRVYLEELYRNIAEFDDFDVVGHIGYVDKYIDGCDDGEEARPFTYGDFPELIDEILQSAVGRGKGIEVNTSNYAVHGWPNPHPTIIRRFAELGGEVLTLGSDAHDAERIGQYFDEAKELLRECGAKYICTFTQREAEFHAL